MGLFSRFGARIPRGLAMVTMGFAGIFGMRTPPDPEVVAQTAPTPRATGTGDPKFCRSSRRTSVEMAPDEKNAPDREES